MGNLIFRPRVFVWLPESALKGARKGWRAPMSDKMGRFLTAWMESIETGCRCWLKRLSGPYFCISSHSETASEKDFSEHERTVFFATKCAAARVL